MGDGFYRIRRHCVAQHATVPFTVIQREKGHIVVEWGSIDLVGVYILPRKGVEKYEERLDAHGDLIRQRSPRPVLVTGDFNAHS
jgi:endonuclease/exonuclease/phosphatase (EEP) superfamily protein YafD